MKNDIDAIFSIAGVTVGFKTSFPLAVSEHFQAFEMSGNTIKSLNYVAVFEEVKKLPLFPKQEIPCNSGYAAAWEEEKGFVRRFRDEPNGNVPYAIGSYDWKQRCIRVQYLPEGIARLNHVGGAFFHVAWEEMMLRERRMILHACCVDTEFGGILFSGRSGIGKSTQGELWCKYEKSILVNGDRPVLCKTNGIWNAFGSPYAGSSKCYVNRSVPVRAVVMLQQAESCSIRRLSKAEAFRKIYAQVTVSAWDQECVERACMITEQFVSEIAVYELSCTPDENAVKILKEILMCEREC